MISRSPLSSIFSRPGWVFQPLERGGLQAGRKGKRGKGQTLRCTPKLIDSQSSAHLGASDTTPYWIRWSADSEFEKTKASDERVLFSFAGFVCSDTYFGYLPKKEKRGKRVFFHRKTGESERERERVRERERATMPGGTSAYLAYANANRDAVRVDLLQAQGNEGKIGIAQVLFCFFLRITTNHLPFPSPLSFFLLLRGEARSRQRDCTYWLLLFVPSCSYWSA